MDHETVTTNHGDTPTPLRRVIAVAGAVVAVAGVLVVTQSPIAIILLLADGLPAAILIAAMALAGTWVVPLLRLGSPPLRWQLLIGAGVGIGATSILVLTLGTAGLLGRPLWMVILGAMIVAAVAAMARLSRRQRDADPSPGALRDHHQNYVWLWLLAAPFLATTLLVCVVPPGFLWAEEGFGYDVLEYHLQLPREYLESGRVDYTPHNVYGSFPANAEMLYLLSMIIHGDPYRGAATAKIINAMLAILCVFAAYVAGREMSPRAGIATGVITAGVGWLTYLSGVAYAENAMLLFTMIAVAALMRALRSPGSPTPSKGGGRTDGIAWIRLAGLMTGFACGCKYTAILLVAAPAAAMVLFMPWPTFTSRSRALVAFVLAALAAFSPWLIKNAAMTGNPVFPLANSVFDAYPPGWGQAESLHFAACHQPGPEESPLLARLALLWQRVPGDPLQRFGPLVFLLAALRLISSGRTRADILLAILLFAQVLAWLFTTHLYARFAVPMIIPLVLLAGRAVGAATTPAARRGLTALIIAGTAFSGFMTARLYAQHLYTDGGKLPLEGADGYFLQGVGGGHEHLGVINQSLPQDARVLMIGDAKAFYFRRRVDYCVVFNRNPFIETVRTVDSPRAIIHWLQQQGYTHVLINWAEVARLRGSRYGFSQVIQPDLFDRLSQADLTLVDTFATGDPPKPYAALYRVPRLQ